MSKGNDIVTPSPHVCVCVCVCVCVHFERGHMMQEDLVLEASRQIPAQSPNDRGKHYRYGHGETHAQMEALNAVSCWRTCAQRQHCVCAHQGG